MSILLSQRFLSVLLPSTCCACESDLPAQAAPLDFGLCELCRQRIRWRTSVEYLPGDLEALYAAAEFSGEFRVAIHQFKYQRRDFLAMDFAAEWMKRTPYDIEDYDVLVAVPQSPLKFLTRGYNPAEEVAKLIARQQNKSLIVGALRRNLLSSSQTNKTKTERFRNAQRGFRISDTRRRLRGRSILLVDDVCTTGATMVACARLLKQLGARRVLGAALARDMLS